MKRKLVTAVAVLALLALFLYIQNNWLSATRLVLSFDKLPAGFDGFRIVQLSDLHSKFFGTGQKRIINALIEAKPDIIVLTGDLVDSSHYDESACLELVDIASEIAPVYYVTGNHEWWSGRFGSLEDKLTDSGVTVLRNEFIEFEKNGQTIKIGGMDDIASFNGQYGNSSQYKDKLNGLAARMSGESFRVLLSHRPEQLAQYSNAGFDLVFSGHAHGGQIRIPLMGGLIAPDQGFFPRYTSGVHREGSTVMIISRGLGNSIIPQRLFNRPEIVQVTLKCR